MIVPIKKLKYLGLFGLMTFTLSCATQTLHQEKVDFQANQPIDSSLKDDSATVSFIQPYKQKLDAEMNRVITYTPVDLTKDGFSCTLCNLTADMTLTYINQHFANDPKLQADAVVLNYGGLRRSFNKGPFTVGNVYELMPFENEMMLLTLSGQTVREMMEYLRTFSVGHPVANIQIKSATDYTIKGEPISDQKTYRIATTDYLYNGGDRMFFFAKATDAKVLNLKLRDLLMVEFQKTDTLHVDTNQRIFAK